MIARKGMHAMTSFQTCEYVEYYGGHAKAKHIRPLVAVHGMFTLSFSIISFIFFVFGFDKHA
jgi:hypothetical protein